VVNLNLAGRDFLSLTEYSAEEIRFLLDESKKLKSLHKMSKTPQTLQGKSLGMIFQKRSTRTRVSSEVGMFLMGGHALFLGKDDIQLGVNESIRDTGIVLSRMVSGILARVFEHKTVEDLAEHSNIPVINALSDTYHPLQILADLLTIEERFNTLRDLKIAWIGDGNNVLQTLLVACPKMKIDISVASPRGYAPKTEIVNYAKTEAEKNSTKVEIITDPYLAVNNADVVVTDTFVSMGQESETAARIKAFQSYQVTKRLLGSAKKHCIFMHCLPRHHEEVTDEVFYSPASVVFDEAENRLYTSMAVFNALFGGRT